MVVDVASRYDPGDSATAHRSRAAPRRVAPGPAPSPPQARHGGRRPWPVMSGVLRSRGTVTETTERAPRPASKGGRRVLGALAPSRRAGVLAVADAVVLLGVMWAIHGARLTLDLMSFVYPLANYVVGFAVAAAIHLVVFYFGGLYEPEERLGSAPRLPRTFALIGVAVLLCGGVALLTGQYLMPRGNLLMLLVLGSLGVALNRRLLRTVRTWRHGLPRLLLVGSPEDVDGAERHLRQSAGHKVCLVGSAGEDADLVGAVAEAGATDVLLLSQRTLPDAYPEPLAGLERGGVGVLQVVRPSDSLLGLRGVRELGGMPVVALRSHVMPDSQRHLKRLMDLTLLGLLAPLTLPLTVAVAAYVRVVVGSPILYRQRRVGREGREFALVKFRTMRRDAEAECGPVLAGDYDPRVVGGARWLREARLDELPQLAHVLTGRMAVVGPRPERPELVAHYDEAIAGYDRRREVPPGITGLAQVHGRYHTDPAYKLGHDLQYLVNWSPVVDLQVLLRTVWVVLSRRT